MVQLILNAYYTNGVAHNRTGNWQLCDRSKQLIDFAGIGILSREKLIKE